LKLSKDSSAFVRREVAVSLRDSSYSVKKEILLSIATQYNGNDPWYLETLGSAMETNAETWYNELLSTFFPNQPNSPLNWNKQMVDFAWRLHPVNAVNDLVQRAKDATVTIEERAQMITALAFINDKTAATAMLNLTNVDLTDVKEQSLYWLSFRQSNDWYKLLDWSKINVNTSYQRKLASMKIKFQMMFDNRQSEQGQKRMAKEIALDSMGGQMIIGLMADKKLPTALIPVVAENIFTNPDLAVRIQAGEYFKRSGTDKIFSVTAISKIPGDVLAGKTIFTNNCSSCHKVGLTGNMIGPELTNIGKKFDKLSLIDAIVNPSASIVFGYEPWLLNTLEGESLYGFLISENKQTIVIKDIKGVQHVIPLDKIRSKKKQKKSLMPEPLTAGMTEQNLADIAAFLMSVK
jgi:putative heme-binding domain-containing protein